MNMLQQAVTFNHNVDSFGHKGMSEFCRLSYWKPTTNTVLDLAHMLKGCCAHHFKLMKGDRNFKERKKPVQNQDEKQANIEAKLRTDTKSRIQSHFVCDIQQHRSDSLFQSIQGPPNYLSKSRTPWNKTASLRFCSGSWS